MKAKNKLYYGDNLDILRRYIKDETVDLIYLDPPFKSGKDYNILFDENIGVQSKAQIMAFEDTWYWNQSAAEAFQEVVEGDNQHVSRAMQAFRTLLGETDMLAYLAMMAPRLIELKRVLKTTGSIYLHCDPTASHYLKILMDSVFGVKNFRNEAIWHYKRWPAGKSQFQRMHDVLLFYSKQQGQNTFNIQLEPLTEGTLKRWHGQKSRVEFKDGVRQTTKITEEESPGTPMDDVWDISVINSQARERLGYPTQKPELLLDRIIKASSNKGDVILDPFCGCGTTIAVAQKYERNWIGIDITHIAIALIKHRLEDMFGGKAKFETKGEPVVISGAKKLAKEDPYQFQWWALGLVGARPVEQKKGADKGIDGRIYFHIGKGETKQIVISVKSGNVSVSQIRDLRGVLEREKAEIGVFITMKEPTKPMLVESASAGFFKSPWGKHPTIQILTIKDILNGKPIDYPKVEGSDRTFKKADKVIEELENGELDL